MTFLELLEKINIPSSLFYVLDEYANVYKDNYQEYYDKLKSKDADYKKIKVELDDQDGLKILAIYLLSSLDSYNKYLKLNISEEIFIATFRAYGRFINESYNIYHRYVFDRFFWTYRQNELKLFRIDELEYEILDKEITIHIPSDAKIDEKSIDRSLDKAYIFFNTYFNIKNDYPYSLFSWLLAPALRKVLKKDSNIIKLQDRFEITNVYEDDSSFMIWVFKTLNTNFDKLPEDTSLQRGIKALLKDNIKIGCAKGYLKQERAYD